MEKSRIEKMIDEMFPRVPEGAEPGSANITANNVHNYPAPAIQARQELFLEAVEQGWSDAKSRKSVGVSQAVLDLWRTDPEFQKQYDAAYSAATGYLEDLAFVRAHASDNVLIRLLEARKPETYKPKAGGGTGNINVIIAPLFDQGPREQAKIIINGDSNGND